jgi:hypothetical protein
MRDYAQIQNRLRYMITVGNTTWLYPLQYVEQALAATTIPHTWDGVNIVCSTVQRISEIYSEIWGLTAFGAHPTGFNIGVGTVLQDYGREIYFRTEDGTFYIHWRNVKQLTDQTTLPSGGDSPNGTIGFVTVNASYNNDNYPYPAIFEQSLTVRLG